MEGRVIQIVLLAAIAAVIGGSLFCEFYIAPRYRRWRVRRVHRHIRELLSVYRSLRRQFQAHGLEDVFGEVLTGQDCLVKEEAPPSRGQDHVGAVLSPSMGENN